MTDQKSHLENQTEEQPAEITNGKVRAKISALNYVALSLADPNYGDARRDELALAALAACIGRAKRTN